MENAADLMQRLLEIQSGGEHRSPELIAEDERLIEGLRNLAGKFVQTVGSALRTHSEIQARSRILEQNPRKSTRSAEGMAVRQEWSIKYRAAILERNPAFQLLRMTEANEAIQRRMGHLKEASGERRKLENALEALNLLRNRRA
jgi:hypothetical protein